MASVESNGITIEYTEEGDGEPMLLIMGLSGQLIDWPEGFVSMLVDHGFRVIRHDNRDAGLSSATEGEPPTFAQNLRSLVLRRRSPAAYTVTDMADDAAGLLAAIGVDAAHVVGVSMGGMIAQSMAINHPDRVRSLTSIMSNTGDQKRGRISPRIMPKLLAAARSTPSRHEAAEVATDMYRLFAGSEWDRRDHLERAQAAIDRSFRPEGTAHQTAAIGASPDRTAALAEVTAPTLVIHGLLDTLVVPSGGMATAEAVPGSRLLMFAEMGHDLPESRWAEMAKAIADNARRAPVGAR
ncbi:MAG: alpha/beta hydrolase [Actinomycetota bacterium]